MVAGGDQPSDQDDVSQLQKIAVQCVLILRPNDIPKVRKRQTEQQRRRRQQRHCVTSSATSACSHRSEIENRNKQIFT
jgi:hypothetical protein